MNRAKSFLKWIIYFITTFVVIFTVFTFFFWVISEKSNDRKWEVGQEKIPEIIFNENNDIVIKDFRNFNWNSEAVEKKYEFLPFNLNEIMSMEVGVSHFHANEGIGHVFLIWKLEDGRDFALSVESRRELGEEFTFLGGLKFDYEIGYFLASKKDLLSLREKRDERVYVYPLKVGAKKSQEIFKILSKRINSLKKNPEFYHIIFKNCTNSITREIEKISDKSFPIWERTFVPGHAGRALFEMGIIETEEKDFKKVREEFLIKF